jgi:hypothetical protein
MTKDTRATRHAKAAAVAIYEGDTERARHEFKRFQKNAPKEEKMTYEEFHRGLFSDEATQSMFGDNHIRRSEKRS